MGDKQQMDVLSTSKRFKPHQPKSRLRMNQRRSMTATLKRKLLQIKCFQTYQLCRSKLQMWLQMMETQPLTQIARAIFLLHSRKACWLQRTQKGPLRLKKETTLLLLPTLRTCVLLMILLLRPKAMFWFLLQQSLKIMRKTMSQKVMMAWHWIRWSMPSVMKRLIEGPLTRQEEDHSPWPLLLSTKRKASWTEMRTSSLTSMPAV